MSEASRDQNHVPTALGVSSVDSVTPTPFQVNPVTGRLLTDVSGGGSGTVTSVSVTTANGVSGTVATATTTPAITLTLGAITPSAVQISGLTASEIVITDASKNLVSAAVATYPSLTELTYVKGVTSSIQTQLNAKGVGDMTLAGVQTVTGAKTFGTIGGAVGKLIIAGATSGSTILDATAIAGSGTVTLPTTGTLATLAGNEALTNKSVNGMTITASTGTFTLTNAKTISFANSIAFAGTDSTTITFPTSSKTVAANDGTNWTFASQAIGDLVYASSTTAFTRLAAVAVGQVLASAGTGTAPAYSANPSVTTLELGAGQTDTTLSRASAGVLAVEGVNVLTTATGLPLSGGTMTGNITLGENASIDLDPAGSADGKYTGICITGTAGTTLAFGDCIYLAVADSRWELTDADAAATAGTPLIGMCVLAAAADGSATKILLQGTIRADAKFPALTIGAPAYVGETAGAIQVAIPTGADNIIRVVGRALTADELYFCPSQDHQVTVA